MTVHALSNTYILYIAITHGIWHKYVHTLNEHFLLENGVIVQVDWMQYHCWTVITHKYYGNTNYAEYELIN